MLKIYFSVRVFQNHKYKTSADKHRRAKIFEEGSLGRVYLRFVEACREIDRSQTGFEPSVAVPAEEENFEESEIFHDETAVLEREDSLPEILSEDDASASAQDQEASSEKRERSVPFEFLRPTR